MLRRWWRSRTPQADEAPESGGLVGDDAEWSRPGELVELRRHRPENRAAFQRWYADPEIAGLLRHDQEPLNAIQARGYFDSFILPLSARGACWAIHELDTGRLLGTTAVTDIVERRGDGASGLFRIVIGEKDAWGKGYGTEATILVLEEAFDEMDLDEIRLEVFRHNPRAIAAYRRVGFRVTGEHVEWLNRRRTELHVLEMAITAGQFWDIHDPDSWDSDDDEDDDDDSDDGDDFDDDDEDADDVDDEDESDDVDDGTSDGDADERDRSTGDESGDVDGDVPGHERAETPPGRPRLSLVPAGNGRPGPGVTGRQREPWRRVRLADLHRPGRD
ncbi:MAG: GNAT family N-acetyltransferase [Chloroflexota bacterium]